MSKTPSPSPSPNPRPSRSASIDRTRELDGTPTPGVDDPESTMRRVALLVDQLHEKVSSPHEKELITARLLGILKARKEARALLGSHAQAMPLFISILRHGTRVAQANVATIFSVLCKKDDLRIKVLLGGCVPPLLALLKTGTLEAKKAVAEAIYEVSSGGLSEDHVGMKIFVTEGVVPALWEQLNTKDKLDKVVEGFITGALRNLCGDKDGYWRATLDSGGVDVIVALLSSDNAVAQSNAASLLARLMLSFDDSIPKIIDSGAIKALLSLMDQKNEILVRANSADALEVLSSKSTTAKKSIVDAQGVPILIGAVVAPSKERMKGEVAQALQTHSTRALSNIFGGMKALILHLGELSQAPRLSAPVADIIGALAYCLMVFDEKSDADEEPFDAKNIENILAILLKPRDNKLVQDRVLEAMASLYGNDSFAKVLNQADAKRVLTGLATMASADTQEYLITSLISLCYDQVSVWEAIRSREGIQLLISFLGLSSEQHQEYAVELLAILTDQVEDSKWAITAAGGIPPLVQLLETGTQRAKEMGANVLRDLCCHSEDIRACVESAGTVPAFLWLLKTGGPKVQEASAKGLTKIIREADMATISQLLALLLGDMPSSKVHIISVLGHVLSLASHNDLVNQGAAGNRALRALVEILNSSNEETQEHTTSVLVDLFGRRQDICDSLKMDEVISPCIKLLESKIPVTATQPAKPKTLGALSLPKRGKYIKKKSYIAEGDVKPLIKLAKMSSIDSAEAAVEELANLLSDPEVAFEALSEDIVSALTRVLAEGSVEGKKNAARALHQLLTHFHVEDVLTSNAKCRFTVLAITDALKSFDMDGIDAADALEVVALLTRTKDSSNFTYAPWSALSEVPSSIEPLVRCLAEGPAVLQDKAIEILSRLCGDQPVVLGDLLVSKSKSIGQLANRIMHSDSIEVKVGGTALLICAAKEHKNQTMDIVCRSGYLKPLIYALVDMMKQNSSVGSLEIEVSTPRGFAERTVFQDGEDFPQTDPATVLGGTVALWLLSIISAFHAKSKATVVEAGGLEALTQKLSNYTSNPQAEFEDTEGIWISALLMAILFQDTNIVSSPAVVRVVPSLALLLKSDEVIDRYFAAQAIASLVCSGNKGINFAVANSGAVAGLISLIGYVEADMPNLIALSEEFSLVRNPDQVVLEHVFAIEDVRLGSTARKTIPLLVDLLRPMPERPGAPPFAVRLLTRIAEGSDANKLYMAEAGALDALPKYLSLSPQDLTEATISELLRILFSNPELLKYEAAISSLSQLVAVLRLGSRNARLSACRALNELFDAYRIRDCEMANNAIQPLMDMLNAASEIEQHAASTTLIKLMGGTSNTSKVATTVDVEGNPLECLYRILCSSSSLNMKSSAAQLCSFLFINSKFRMMPTASKCMRHLIMLMRSDIEMAVESGVCAFERLLDDEQQLELAAESNVLNLLVNLVSGSNHKILAASIGSLIKLGKDRTPRKLDMVNASVIDKCLTLLPTAPSSICSLIAELFRILTNSSVISKKPAAANIVEPLFALLLRPDFGLSGQHSALQTLVNILEKPESLSTLKLTPSQVIEPLISFIESPSQAIQQLGTELLNHLLAQEHFQQDITAKNTVVPLVQLTGIGILNLQHTAIKALEKISLVWPKVVADAGGIYQLSKVIIQDHPEPTLEMLELAALVLCNILRYNADYYFRVPLVVLVKMLHSHNEDTVTLSLNALIIQEQTDASSAEQMAEAGTVDALLDLLRSHQCEEASSQLLEALFNNVRVREMKVAKYAIAPIAHYLLDPQTKSESARLLAALALGDLSQHEFLARVNDSVAACRALVSLLEDKGTDEIKAVAICALQNFVMHSRTNRRAVAEIGGILVIQQLLLSPNREIAMQAVLLIKFLFSNHTLQDYASNELIRSLMGAFEKELMSSGTFNLEILKTINIIFTNFSKVHVSEAATLCIPHMVSVIKSGNEAAQDSALNILCALKHSWSTMPTDVSRNQATTAAEAIPILQMFIKSCPPSLQDRAYSLLHALPGCLTVTIKRANNLRQLMGGTHPFCRLMIGNGLPKQTKVINYNTNPEWDEKFTWAFDVPPKGQKLHIQCRSKSTFGKTNLGRASIQIDKVVSEGVQSGVFNITTDSNREGSARTVELEMTWSNSTSNEKEKEKEKEKLKAEEKEKDKLKEEEKETIGSEPPSQAENETKDQAENETKNQAENETKNQAENELDAPSPPQNQNKDGTESQSQNENEAETQSQNEVETQNQNVNEAITQSQRENETLSQNENKAKTQNENEAETQTQNENEANTQSQNENEANTQSQNENETNTQSQAQGEDQGQGQGQGQGQNGSRNENERAKRGWRILGLLRYF